MKRTNIILLSALSTLLLTSCNFSLFKWSNKNAFYSASQLNDVGLKGLPVIEYQSSYVEKSGNTLKGYFEIEDEYIHAYAKNVLNYFKNSDITYGINLGKFNAIFNTVSEIMPKVDHLDFYKWSMTTYDFYYVKGDNTYRLNWMISHNENSGKTYNALLRIKPLADDLSKWKDDYKEIILTNENIKDYVGVNSYIAKSNNNERYIGLELTLPDYYNGFADIDFNVEYTYLGNPSYYHWTIRRSSGININNVLLERISDSFKEEDFQITDLKIVDDSAIVLKKR